MELKRPLLCWLPTQAELAADCAEQLGCRYLWLLRDEQASVSSWRKQLMAAAEGWDAVLIWDELGLAMQVIEHPLPHPVRVDFLAGEMVWRAQHLSALRSEAVVKACAVHKAPLPWVLDATAGLGRDAWILANLGCRVTLFERSPIVQRLLRQGIDQALQHSETASAAARLELNWQDAHAGLSALIGATERPDVVYLDPMFPHRDKSAMVKKDMKVFRSLVGADADADGLLQLARQVARKRVVVKRPRIAPDLAGVAPQLRLQGQSSRFDIYLP